MSAALPAAWAANPEGCGFWTESGSHSLLRAEALGQTLSEASDPRPLLYSGPCLYRHQGALGSKCSSQRGSSLSLERGCLLRPEPGLLAWGGL